MKKISVTTVPEGCALENMRDAGMGVRFVAIVGIHIRTKEGGEIFIHDDGLERGDHPPPGCLEDILVIPGWINLLHSGRLNTRVSVLVSYPANILILVS